MNLKYTLRDIEKIRKMRKYALLPNYTCSGEIYKLLLSETMHSLIKELNNNKKVPKIGSNLNADENFLTILDNYIGYIHDNYLINHNEFLKVLDLSLKNNYNKCLLDQRFFYDNYEDFIFKFKELFLYNLFNNTIVFAKEDEEKNFKYIQKASAYLENKNINNICDIEKIESFFVNVINKRKSNLVYCFKPYNLIITNKKEFYMEQLEWLYEDYYEK